MVIQRKFKTLGAGLTVALALVAVTACGGQPTAQQTGSDQTMPHGAMTDSAGMGHGSMSMDLGPKDANFDLRFLDAMMLHHEGAIAMAQDIADKTERLEVKDLAEDIISAQQAEISQMKQWRQAWYPNAGADPVMYDAGMGHEMAMSPELKAAMMMNEDLGEADDQVDLRFINAMIPHHEGALDMAKQVLERSDRPELRQLAQTILASQQDEIDQMKEWRKEWYNQ